MNCWKIQNLTFFGFTANSLEFLGACLSLHCCRCRFFTGIFSAFLAVEVEGFLVKVKGESFFGGRGLANSKSKFRLSSKSLSIQFWNKIKNRVNQLSILQMVYHLTLVRFILVEEMDKSARNYANRIKSEISSKIWQISAKKIVCFCFWKTEPMTVRRRTKI